MFTKTVKTGYVSFERETNQRYIDFHKEFVEIWRTISKLEVGTKISVKWKVIPNVDYDAMKKNFRDFMNDYNLELKAWSRFGYDGFGKYVEARLIYTKSENHLK